MNRLITNFGNVKFNVLSVLSISEELTNNEVNESKKHDNKNEISNIIFKKLNLINLDFRYKSSKEFIFKNLNLELKSNKAILITGSSGCGKSTLIDIILGLLKPLTGSIIINDHYEISRILSKWHQLVSYIPQSPIFIDDSIKNNVALGSLERDIDEKKIIECLKIAKIYDYLSSIENFLDFNIGEKGNKLSGGQKQRLAIARALYKDPSVIIFDETTNSLDIDTEENIIKDIVNLRKNKTLIFVSHNERIFKYFDILINIDEVKNLKSTND